MVPSLSLLSCESLVSVKENSYRKFFYVAANGFIFLQETHSCINDEIRWRDEFNGELFFFHGKKKTCGVAIDFYGPKTIEQTKYQINQEKSF